MAGSAYTVSTVQASSRAAIGRHSMTLSTGAGRSSGAQKCRMPARDRAISDISPEPTTSTSQVQAHRPGGSLATSPRPAGFSSVVSMPNLPMKPDSGGMPVSSSVQPMKASPRKAMAAGMARPISTSSSSSRFMPASGSSSSGGGGTGTSSSGGGLPRERSTSSDSRKNALTASVELNR